ncbi:hypothetical protein Pfo_024539 [Paulownia fortunei]|nr:hypothetical protein Pfo_024539 [Paulownia fortunei]
MVISLVQEVQALIMLQQKYCFWIGMEWNGGKLWRPFAGLYIRNFPDKCIPGCILLNPANTSSFSATAFLILLASSSVECMWIVFLMHSCMPSKEHVETFNL